MQRALLFAFAIVLGCSATPAATDLGTVHVADPVAPSASASASEAALEDGLPPDHQRSPPRPRHDTGERDVASDDATARARALFQKGAAAYASGDFPAACAAFEAAYDLAPVAPLLFNMGSCQLRMGNVQQACGTFRKYVAQGDPSDPRIQEVQAQIAQRCKGVP